MALNAAPLTEEERRSVIQGPGDVEWKYVFLRYLHLVRGIFHEFTPGMKCVASAKRSYLASY